MKSKEIRDLAKSNSDRDFQLQCEQVAQLSELKEAVLMLCLILRKPKEPEIPSVVSIDIPAQS